MVLGARPRHKVHISLRLRSRGGGVREGTAAAQLAGNFAQRAALPYRLGVQQSAAGARRVKL